MLVLTTCDGIGIPYPDPHSLFVDCVGGSSTHDSGKRNGVWNVLLRASSHNHTMFDALRVTALEEHCVVRKHVLVVHRYVLYVCVCTGNSLVQVVYMKKGWYFLLCLCNNCVQTEDGYGDIDDHTTVTISEPITDLSDCGTCTYVCMYVLLGAAYKCGSCVTHVCVCVQKMQGD